MHPAALPIDELLKQCEFSRSRTRGPGGQHRNKVETGITIKHLPTDITAQALEARKQEENRRRAIRRLRTRLAVRHRDFVPVPRYVPRDRVKPRLLKGRISVNPRHEDYAVVLAEILDLVAELRGDMRTASQYLDVSSSQIVKFLKTEPEAFEALNEIRRRSGKSPLK